MKNLKSSKLYLVKNNVTIDENNLITFKSDSSKSEFNLKEILYCYQKNHYIMLYIANNQFMIIITDRMKEGDLNKFLTILESLEIKMKE